MEDESTQNESMKDKPEKIEKNDKKEDNSKNNSDERINNKKIKQKDNSQSLEERQSQAYKKKLKSRFSPNKRKRINMYLVLTIFCSLLLACLVISHFYFENDIKQILDKNKKLSLFLFIFLIIGSLVLSAFACLCECFIKTHLFGILFFIILNLSNNYCIIYSTILVDYFEQLFCGLIILVSGSMGLLIITILVKDEIPSLLILFIFNGLFSFIAGCIMCYIYPKPWNIFFSILSIIISEFNVYSSQYQFGSKEKKIDTLIYCQPFELIISIFKLFYFIINIILKIIKICYKVVIKCKNKNKNKIDNKSTQQENAENEGENHEEEEIGEEQKEGKIEVHDQSQNV